MFKSSNMTKKIQNFTQKKDFGYWLYYHLLSKFYFSNGIGTFAKRFIKVNICRGISGAKHIHVNSEFTLKPSPVVII